MKNSQTSHTPQIRPLLAPFVGLAMPAIAALLCVSNSPALAEPGNDKRAPDVPSALEAPAGNKVAFHAYAIGVQIYTATPSPADPTQLVWTFKAPEAVLFDNDGNLAGLHYAGPTWESESGGTVRGARVAGAVVDATAIPWLLLRTTSTEGPGIFARTTFIQRVNTTGGLAPSPAPSQTGQEARVPYTADYFFYRAAQQ